MSEALHLSPDDERVFDCNYNGPEAPKPIDLDKLKEKVPAGLVDRIGEVALTAFDEDHWLDVNPWYVRDIHKNRYFQPIPKNKSNIA